MDKLKFALIGTGGIAQTYAQAFQISECCEITAVADINVDAATAFAEPFNAVAINSYRELAEKAEFDAVIISTPPSTHLEIAEYFMSLGKHILCEKPLCPTIDEAERMLSTAESSGVTFTMASKFRFVEDVIKAKAMITSGVLGDIVQFENAFTAKVDMSDRWNSDPAISGGGVLMDNGTHSVDIIRYLLGPIREVIAIDAGKTQGLAVDENVRMFARTEGGVVATVDLTWGLNKELSNFISIYGTNGTLHIGWRESKYKVSTSPDWVVFGKGYDKVHAFKAKIENFRNAIHGKEDLLISPIGARASVEVIAAAYRSLESDSWVPVKGLADTASA